MTRIDIAAGLITGAMIALLSVWVIGSSRHRSARFELDCTAPPEAPTGVAVRHVDGMVTAQWQLAADPQVSTSYTVEFGSAPGLHDRATIGVGRGIDRVTIALPAGRSFARVVAQNYCGTSLPSDEITVTVP